MAPDKTRPRAAWLAGALRFALPAGALLLLAAFVVWIFVDPPSVWRSAPVMAPGALGALLIAAGALSAGRRLASTVFRRRAAAGLNVGVMVALATGVVVLANLASAQRSVSWHWTEQELYALSSNTLNLLDEVSAGDEDLRITAALGAYPFANRVMTLLEEYARHSPRVKVDRVDFYRDAGRVEMLKQDLRNPVRAESLVFQYGDRDKVVEAQDLVEMVGGGFFSQEQAKPRFRGEAVVTAAIREMIARGGAKVYFSQGHGEFDLEDHNVRGLSEIVKRLRRDNYETGVVNLAEHGVPEDCDVLAVVGPSMSFSETTVESVRDFLLDRGGKLLLLPRPQAALGRATGLRELLYDEFGLNIRDDLLVATSRGAGAGEGDPQITVSRWGDHPITRDLGNLTALFTWSCPVERIERQSAPGERRNPRYRVTTLARSSPHTWGETTVNIESVRDIRRDAHEQTGPFSLGVAVEREDRGENPGSRTRLVVIGNPVSATNQVMSDDQMAARYVNRALILGSINWLAERDYDVGIEPLRVRERPLHLDRRARRLVRAVSWFALPFGLIGVASLVLWRRSRA